MTRFAILFEGRTGSSYLVDCLASHPEVRVWKEVLDKFVGFRASLDARHRDAEREASLPPGQEIYPLVDGAAELQLAETRKMLGTSPARDVRAVGFKTKLSSVLQPPRLSDTLREFDARIVYMRRHNLVKQVVSSLNAGRIFRATGRWNLRREEDRLPPFHIDPAMFEALLERREATEQRLAAYVRELAESRPALQVLTVRYEDILSDRDGTFAAVQRHIGVTGRSLHGRTLKNTDDDLGRVVENLAELKARFTASAYATMFDAA